MRKHSRMNCIRSNASEIISGTEDVVLDRGPTSLQLRSFSDSLDEQIPRDGPVAESLRTEVPRDREAERRVATLKHEWVVLFADADHLSKM